MTKKKHKLATIYPLHVTSYGIGNAALMISENMRTDELDVEFFSPASDKEIKSEIKNDLFGRWLKVFYYKILSEKQRARMVEWLFLKKTKSYDSLYIWPGISNDFIHKVKERGQTVILENINCHVQTASDILKSEYNRLNLTPPDDLGDKSIAYECERLELCDYVFSPSPEVSKSLIKSGLESEKILRSSYGLKSDQRLNSPKPKSSASAINALFVGRVGVRKGVHLLLEYWSRANIDGTLRIVGAIEPAFREIAQRYDHHENIEFISFTHDLDQLYRQADLFIIPSLEEGSPLVTYLAIGNGLPCLVSPMGGDGIIRDGMDGLIIDPHNGDAWVDHIRSIAASVALRDQMAKSAYERSEDFLWQNVGRQRAKLVIDKLSKNE